MIDTHALPCEGLGNERTSDRENVRQLNGDPVLYEIRRQA